MSDALKNRATLAGFGAIGLWSTTMGVSRLASEALGPLTAGGVVCLLAGILGSLLWYTPRGALRELLTTRRRYLYGCGGLFVLYAVSLYAAVGLASGRAQVLEVAIINYLWPALTMTMSLWFFRLRPRRLLGAGILAALAGVVLAMTPEQGYDLAALRANLATNALPYLLALSAAVGWALYSNLARLWGAGVRVRGVPLYFLICGALMLLLAAGRGERPDWSLTVALIVLFMAVGPAMTAYYLWDYSMQHGDMTLVVSVSYLTPVLSTLVSCLVFRTLGGWTLWIGCVLVVAGAVICRRSVHQPLNAEAKPISD